MSSLGGSLAAEWRDVIGFKFKFECNTKLISDQKFIRHQYNYTIIKHLFLSSTGYRKLNVAHGRSYYMPIERSEHAHPSSAVHILRS